jgi:hypothetical protein
MGMKHLISLMWNFIPLVENVVRGYEVIYSYKNNARSDMLQLADAIMVKYF